MGGAGLASTMTDEGQASIFIAVDHGSTECIGIHAARRATRFEALEPVRQGVRACFGASAAGIAGGLRLRHDHGSQYVGHDFQAEIAFVEELRRAPLDFRRLYNATRLVERHGYRTPAQVRADQLGAPAAAA